MGSESRPPAPPNFSSYGVGINEEKVERASVPQQLQFIDSGLERAVGGAPAPTKNLPDRVDRGGGERQSRWLDHRSSSFRRSPHDLLVGRDRRPLSPFDIASGRGQATCRRRLSRLLLEALFCCSVFVRGRGKVGLSMPV